MGNATQKFHPLTGAPIVPLGYRKDGRAIWPIMGGDDTVPPADPPPSDPPPADPPSDPPADPGKGGKDAILADLATERDKRQALEKTVTDMQAAQKQQMDALATALGIKPADTPPDPAALTAQIEAEKATATDAQRQLAIYQNAGEADPKRLLDSASFLRSVKDIDPTDTAAITAAVTAAVEADPLLKAVQPPSTPPFPGGPRTPAPTGAGSLGEAIANKLAATQPR